MMAEPISQLVAPMPRARFLGLMALFLGPAIAIYTQFSIYPLIATMGLSTYTSDSAGGYHFVGLANFVTLLTDSFWSKPFWNAARNNLIFFCVHMAVQNPIGIALAGLLSLPPDSDSRDSIARSSSCRRCCRWSSSAFPGI
jgi:raffinose/stachyose/melibiose transport system permease protein